MPPPSIFTRPRRAVLPTVAQAQTEFPVRTDEELRNAIGAIAARGSSGDGGAFGCRITLVAPIFPSTGYSIPSTCGGMQITAAGLMPFIPQAPIAALFTVNARALQLLGLLVEAPSTTNAVTTFIKTDTSAVQHMLVRDCIVNADRFLLDTAGKAGSSRFIDNEATRVTATANPMIDSAATICRCRGNRFNSAAAAPILKLEAGAEWWSITDNHFGGRDIDTSASSGFNTISNNTQMGATSAFAATDAVGLNT